MTSKFKMGLLSLSMITFAGLLGLAVYLESAIYLYAASELPVVIAALLPDRIKHQYADAAHNRNVRLTWKL